LPQFQSCTFLCQLQEMAPGTLICREFKKVPILVDDCPWIILNTSMRSALIRLSSKDHKFSCYNKSLMELILPTFKHRGIRGYMIEVYKLLTNKYDDNTVHLDINLVTRTRGRTKKLVVRRCRCDVRKY